MTTNVLDHNMPRVYTIGVIPDRKTNIEHHIIHMILWELPRRKFE